MRRDQIINLGRTRKRTMPAIAFLAAEAAARREIGSDDAAEIYSLYRAHSPGGIEVVTVDRAFYVQTSKLRQIIKAADPELLARVTKMYGQEPKPKFSLYDCMVAACRKKLAGRKLGDRALRELIRGTAH